jgi:hypothetical protein
LFAVYCSGSPTLDTIRDRLRAAGVDRACFTDGSSSAVMFCNRRIERAASMYESFKDHLVEWGFAFVDEGGANMVELEVELDELVVDQITSVVWSSDSHDRWNLRVRVDGRVVWEIRERVVQARDTISIGTTHRVRIPANQSLEIEVSGEDVEDVDEDLPRGTASYDRSEHHGGQESSDEPRRHRIETRNYTLRFSVARTAQ